MKIAQVAPLFESVPPKFYAGTERVVSYLTEELVRQGHEVTLYASGDSETRARLRSPVAQSLRLSLEMGDSLVNHFIMLEEVFEQADDYDVLHFHVGFLHFPLARRDTHTTLTTLHGRLDLPELQLIHRRFPEMPLVSISNAQRSPIAWANWRSTIYHGLPEESLVAHEQPEGYLAFLGRISPEKRVDLAIEIASRTGYPIKIAAKVDKVDQDYFDSRIRPLLSWPGVEFIGEIGEHEKNAFLGGATALLFPIDGPEPFGLVMIESMACGTPVIAYSRGSVPEVIDEGLTGFVVSDIDAAVAAVDQVEYVDRVRCRKIFEQRFSARRMASDYVDIYSELGSVSELISLNTPA